MKKILCLMAFVLSLAARPITAAPIQVKVDLNAQLCTNFLGFGVQWSPYPWFDISDAAWQRVYDRLDFMRIPIVRVMTRAYKYCDGFDAAGKPIYSWENNRMKKLYRLLDYCESRHVKVIIGEWDDPASPEDRADKASDKLKQYNIDCTDPRWSELICDFLEHLIRDKHYTCLAYYNLINEPNGGWSHCADFTKWKTGIGNLQAELHKRGLDKGIKITGPDVTWVKDFYWVERAVTECPKLLGAYDVHEYVAYEDLESDYLEKVLTLKRDYINRFDPEGRKKPFFMGEIGMNRRGPVEPQGGEDSHPKVYEHIYGVWMTDYCIQAARAGMAGTIAWMLDDAMHINKNADNGWPDIHKTLFKKWGFFNSLAEEIGHPEDAKLRPWFYTWSLMSRSFPAGCRTLKSSSNDIPGLRTLAATIGNDDISLAMVNDSDKEQQVNVLVPEWSQSKKIKEYDYFTGSNPVDQHGFAVPAKFFEGGKLKAGMSFTLPPRSVVILSSLN